MNFERIATGLDVAPLRAQLLAQPELWGENPERIIKTGPHAQTHDIWVRFRAREDLTEPQHFGEPHFAVFYPAWKALPALHALTYDLMRRIGAVYLGGILITRIPAGAQVLPHDDRGSWHAEWLNTKVYLPIQSNPGCLNICEDERVSMQEGEAWTFDNLKVHAVENNGATDRITAILCCRTEP